MHSLKTKIIIANSLFLIFLFGVTAFLLIGQKEAELNQDIYLRMRSYVELTAPALIDDYRNLLEDGAYPFFQRNVTDLFQRNADVESVVVINYAGEIVYDSDLEQVKRYDGPPRSLKDDDLLVRVQATHPSFLLSSGRVFYLIKNDSGAYVTVDKNEVPIADFDTDEQIVNVVYPDGGQYAVNYTLTYAVLEERVQQTSERITMLALFAVLLGLLLAYVFSSRIINPLKRLTEAVQVIAQGEFRQRIKVRSHDEVATLAESVNQLAQDLEKSTRQLVVRERVAREVELAAKIQQELLPKKVPTVAGLDVSAELVPAAEIGGDCFDFIKVDEKNLLMYIGDVTGHGVPSGLVVAIANAIIYSMSNLKNLKEILIRTNSILARKTSPNMFLTMLLLQWNSEEKVLSFVSAGHEQMLMYRKKEDNVVESQTGGMALGMVEDIGKLLNQYDFVMIPGDVAVLYTDGIPEATSSEGEQFGKQRLVNSLQKYAGLGSAESIKNAILSDLRAFVGTQPQLDDMTILVIKRV